MGQHQKNEKMNEWMNEWVNKEIIVSYSYVHSSVVNCPPPLPLPPCQWALWVLQIILCVHGKKFVCSVCKSDLMVWVGTKNVACESCGMRVGIEPTWVSRNWENRIQNNAFERCKIQNVNTAREWEKLYIYIAPVLASSSSRSRK